MPSQIPTTCIDGLVSVDGHSVPVRLIGSTRDAQQQLPITIEPCTASERLRLGAGTHELRSVSTPHSGLGVDVNRIPDPAWHAIVDMSIASAKDRALCARSAADQPARYWKANLAGALEEEALEISKFMQGSTCSGRSVAPQILVEYRV